MFGGIDKNKRIKNIKSNKSEDYCKIIGGIDWNKNNNNEIIKDGQLIRANFKKKNYKTMTSLTLLKLKFKKYRSEIKLVAPTFVLATIAAFLTYDYINKHNEYDKKVQQINNLPMLQRDIETLNTLNPNDDEKKIIIDELAKAGYNVVLENKVVDGKIKPIYASQEKQEK